MSLQEKRSVEIMLRTHIHHLQEQLNSSHTKKDFGKTEDLLRQRIENLLNTLDKVIQTSQLRQTESADLIQDLKRANRYTLLLLYFGRGCHVVAIGIVCVGICM